MYQESSFKEKRLGDMERLTFGLSWDMIGDDVVDLDASCVFFDGYARIIDAVFYNQLDIGYAIHSGDNKTGEGEGFDETIQVNLSKLEPNIESFMLVINCYSGGNFLTVETAEAKILNGDTNEVLTEVLVGCKGASTGLLLCMCWRDKKLGWMFKEIGRVCEGKNFQECEKEMKEELVFLVDPIILENEMRWEKKSKKVFNLKKGDELHLGSLETVTMGLGWDTRCDLDASVIEIGMDGNARFKVYYGCKKNQNGSILHHGDNTTGEGEGDDEQITVNLKDVHHLTGFLVFMVNVYTANKDFSNVRGAFARLFMMSKKKKEKEICRFNLSDGKTCTAIVMAIIYRDENMKSWMFRAVGGEINDDDVRVAREFDAEEYVGEADLRDMKNRLTGKNSRDKIRKLEVELEHISQPIRLQNAISMKCRAIKVDKMDFFGKSDPYYILKKPDGTKVYKSEVVKVTLDPIWKQTVVKNVPGGLDVDVVHTIDVYDWDRLSSDDYIGSFAFVPSQVQPGSQFELINEKKKRKKKRYKNSGVFVFDRFSTEVYDQCDEYYKKKSRLELEKNKHKEMFDSFKGLKRD